LVLGQKALALTSAAEVAPSPPRPNRQRAGGTSADPSLRHPPKANHATGMLRLMGPLLGMIVAWSLGGEYLVNRQFQQIIEIGAIVGTGAFGLLLASYAHRRTMQLERAYSTHLEELSQRLRSLAYRDSLTDLYNHRYFHEQLSHEVERAARYNRPLSVILMDLDNFKQINDNHGHLTGDRLLALVGQVIKNYVRSADVAARYGGDEFAILLPDTSLEAAEATARKLAQAVATGRTYSGPLSDGLPVSVSYGVASCPEEARGATELLQLADDRLYAAKAGLIATKGSLLLQQHAR